MDRILILGQGVMTEETVWTGQDSLRFSRRFIVEQSQTRDLSRIYPIIVDIYNI